MVELVIEEGVMASEKTITILVFTGKLLLPSAGVIETTWGFVLSRTMLSKSRISPLLLILPETLALPVLLIPWTLTVKSPTLTAWNSK